MKKLLKYFALSLLLVPAVAFGQISTNGDHVTLSAPDSAVSSLNLSAPNAAAKVSIYKGGSERLKVDGTLGDVTILTGNLSFSGAGKGIGQNIATLAALGTNQATCAPIVSSVARVTAADGTVGVCLPAGAAADVGKQVTVINSDVTNALKVYAAGAETITGQAGTTAISVAAKLWLRCVLYSATVWYCEKGVLPY